MLKRILIGIVAISSVAYSHNQLSRYGGPVIVSGIVDCKGGGVQFLTGALKGRTFPDLTTAMIALDRRGYEGEPEQFQQILGAACKGDLFGPTKPPESTMEGVLAQERTMEARPGDVMRHKTLEYRPSSLLRLVQDSRGLKFTVWDKDLETNEALAAYARGTKRRDCKQTSNNPPADCFKCANPLEVWCNIRKLAKKR